MKRQSAEAPTESARITPPVLRDQPIPRPTPRTPDLDFGPPPRAVTRLDSENLLGLLEEVDHAVDELLILGTEAASKERTLTRASYRRSVQDEATNAIRALACLRYEIGRLGGSR